MYRLFTKLLILTYLSVVCAEHVTLSDIQANNDYPDVQSIYIDGYYVMLYVGNKNDTLYSYSLGLYELVDGGSLIKHIPEPSQRTYRIESSTNNLRLIVQGNEVQPSPEILATVAVCSAHECAEYFIGESLLAFISTRSRCRDRIQDGDRLFSINKEFDFNFLVLTRGSQVVGFLCMPNGDEYLLNFVCQDKFGTNTQFHSIGSTVTADQVNVFVLFKNGQETALCSFSSTITRLTPRISNNIRQSSILVFNYSPTALAVSAASGDHIAFVSSQEGVMSKVYILQSGSAYNIDQLIVEPTITDYLFSDMLLDNDRLLLKTKSRMLLLDVKQTCEQYKDLCACRAPKDPKCGWCVHSNECTSNSTCSGIWIQADPSSRDICYNATVNPKSVSRHNLKSIKISVSEEVTGFGAATRSYQCLYGSTNITSSVIESKELSITCAAPPVSDIESFPEGLLELPVVVYYSTREEYLPLVVQYKMIVCSMITNCGECVRSHDSCTWCINDNKCTTTATVGADCPDSAQPNTRSIFGETDSCPVIDMDILTVPVEENHALILPMNNLPTLQGQSYFCQLVIEGGENVTVPAKRDGNNITCSPYQYGAWQQSQSFYLHNFTVVVLFGDDRWHLATARGKVYDCSHRSVCTQCVQAVDNTKCVWCSDNKQCHYNRCPTGATIFSCPSLDIIDDQVEPTDLPVEGYITLTIPGEGLVVDNGYAVANITIGDQPCTDISPGPNIPPQSRGVQKLRCTVPGVESRRPSDLRVVIDGISWYKSSFINYYDPVLKSLSVYNNNDHKYGPLSGGTDMKITGTDLMELASTEWHIEFINSKLTSYPPLRLTDCVIEKQHDWVRCKTPPVAATGSYMARLQFTDMSYKRNLTDEGQRFEYKPDSTITAIYPSSIIQWGGKAFTVNGSHIDSVSNPLLRVHESLSTQGCTLMSSEKMTCMYPEFNKTGVTPLVIVMDGIDTARTTLNITVKDNPHFNKLDPRDKPKGETLILDGVFIDNVEFGDISVFVGGETCNITKKESTTVICIPPQLTEKQQNKNTDVTVEILGVQRFPPLGTLNYQITEDNKLPKGVIGGISGGAAAAAIIMIIVAVLLFKRSRYHKQRYKSMVKHVDQLECNSRHEIKQAFAELQTDMTDLMSDLNVTGIPYWDYKNFTFKILFPGQTDHPSLHKLMTKRKAAVMQALDMFEHLIQNKDFLTSFIHTLEQQRTFTMPDKVQLAALLMLTLQHKMDYTTTVIKELLSDLIKSSMRDKHPKLLLRRSESVVEKMLTHWLSLCLYKYLQDHAGTPLFMLYKAIKHQIDKGPVDALTGEARYSLSQERLLRLTVDTKPLTLDVILENGERIQCKVNDIDTTTQVKEKILDVLYKNQAFSQRPCALDYNLEWHHGIAGLPICDEDLTSQTVNGWKRLNTLAHYSIPDNATMKLVSRHRPNSLQSDRSLDTDRLCNTLSSNRELGTPRGTLNRNGALSTSNLQDHFIHSHTTLWHLSKSSGSQTLPKDRQQTMMSEIFLTRLLKTKGTLQDFIDALFKTIFSADNLPPTIKFLFDFLDQEALKHGITDPEVVHVWKNNSLNLRFWVNIIKNPEFVFDIHKSEVVDASLSTIAQTFIDSCAMTESDFGVDAPINKLLFAKDRPRYRKMLQNMYSEIRSKPAVPEQTLNAHLNELSKMYPREVYRNSALKEIYQFAQRYQSQIIQDLEENFPKHRNPNLTTLLQDIVTTLDERQTPMTDFV